MDMNLNGMASRVNGRYRPRLLVWTQPVTQTAQRRFVNALGEASRSLILFLSVAKLSRPYTNNRHRHLVFGIACSRVFFVVCESVSM